MRFLLSALLAWFIAALGAGAEPAKPTRPNIIFILADDLGYGDLGCYGQKLIQTPNIDKLAAEGTRFTQCYAGNTVCAPSRCCLMTGLHAGHAYIRSNYPGAADYSLRAEDVTVAQVLKSAGYGTAIIGKWGLGDGNSPGIPNRKGFDWWFGYLNQTHAHNYYPDHLWKNQEKFPLPNVVEKKKTVKAVQYSHDLFAQDALAFLEKQKKDQPFFLYLPFTIPHGRLEVPSDAPYTNRPWGQPQKNFAAMITRLDSDVGKIMKRLKDLNLDENTLVFFTSDNGPHGEGGPESKIFKSSGPLRGKKRDLYEGGIRVPMIARWPGKIQAGTVSDQVWAFWDFLPTAAELAGAAPPKDLDGISMVPVLLGEKAAGRAQQNHEYLYWEIHEKGSVQAVRMGDWKYVRLAEKPGELYDLKNDLGEAKNVAGKHAEVVAKIETYLKNARTESKLFPIKPAQEKQK